MKRKCKIVATLGPKTSTPEEIKKLISAGVNVFRLNFSHGDHKFHSQLINTIKKHQNKGKTPVAILADLQGPKIRVGILDNPLELNNGSIWKISPFKTKEKNIIPSDYKQILSDANPGERILFNDGLIQGVITKKSSKYLTYPVELVF